MSEREKPRELSAFPVTQDQALKSKDLIQAEWPGVRFDKKTFFTNRDLVQALNNFFQRTSDEASGVTIIIYDDFETNNFYIGATDEKLVKAIEDTLGDGKSPRRGTL